MSSSTLETAWETSGAVISGQEVKKLGPPSGFRLRREDEVAARARSLGLHSPLTAQAQYLGDGQRPTPLAHTSEEHRQILAVSRLVCHAVSEALAGSRPLHQLRRWLEEEVYAKVQQRFDLLRRCRSAGTVPQHRAALAVRTMRASRLNRSTWETCVVFHDGQRVRACAMRVEAHRGQWRVCALELG